jgi:hypothetical protein
MSIKFDNEADGYAPGGLKVTISLNINPRPNYKQMDDRSQA